VVEGDLLADVILVSDPSNHDFGWIGPIQHRELLTKQHQGQRTLHKTHICGFCVQDEMAILLNSFVGTVAGIEVSQNPLR
jgi:hypothetical protein